MSTAEKAAADERESIATRVAAVKPKLVFFFSPRQELGPWLS